MFTNLRRLRHPGTSVYVVGGLILSAGDTAAWFEEALHSCPDRRRPI